MRYNEGKKALEGEGMINALLIAAVILLYTMQSFLCRNYADRYPGPSGASSSVFTAVSGFFVVVLSFAVSGFSFAAGGLTLLLGLCNALALVGYNFFLVKASGAGPYSVLIVFSLSGGIAVPALVARFAFGDGISPFKWASLLLVFVSVYLVSRRKGEGGIRSRSFFPLCIGLGIANGAYGALLDVQQRLTGTAEREEMIAVTFGVAMLFSLLTLGLRERKRFFFAFLQTRRSLLFLLTCSLVVAVAINLLVYILPLVDTVLLYTFENAGVMLCSVLCSFLFFKERLSLLNVAGCALMAVSLVGVSVC